MIVTLSGDNEYLLNKYVQEKKHEYLKDYGDLSIEQVDCEEAEPDRITEAIQSLPFLVSNKLVVLLSPSKNKKFIEIFGELISTIPEEVDVIILELKPDKRSSYYKLLKSKTDYKEFKELDAAGLASWLLSEAKTKEANLSSADSRYLVDRVGLNQLRLGSELEKLITYDKNITRDNIDKLTVKSPQSSIFDLIEAAVSGNAVRALELYDEQRQQKVEPQQVIAMLAWQLRILALVKAAGNRPAQQTASEAKLNPYVVGKSQRLAGNLTYQEIKSFVKDLFELDIKLKTVSIDADQALQCYIMSLQK